MQATVRDAMTTDVVSAPRHTSIADAEQILLDHDVEELFVVDTGGLLCGVVPDYELLKWRLGSCSDRPTVESVMSRRFLVIGADSPLGVAARYLREHIHRRLAVVEGRRLIGQITRGPVLAWLASRQDGSLPVSIEAELPDQCPQPLVEIDHSFMSPLRAGRSDSRALSAASCSLAAR